MNVIEIGLRGDVYWPDIAALSAGGKVVNGGTVKVAGLVAGMETGRPSVAIRMDLADSRAVVSEISLALFLTAADTLKAKFGDPREDM